MPVGTYALITVDEYEQYHGSSVENAALCEKLIDRATDIIERWTNRRLRSRSYSKEVYHGNGAQTMLLRNYPVTAVTKIGINRAEAIQIKNTTASWSAFAEVSTTSLTLTKDGTATATLTLSTYATLNLLAAAVIAAGAGWTATVMESSLGSFPASEIIPGPGLYCLSPSVASLYVPDEYLTDFRILDHGEAFNFGRIYAPGGFVSGVDNHFITYTAGYTTTPETLKDACVQLVDLRMNQRVKDTGVSSESLGDYSYSLRDLRDGLPPELYRELEGFRKFPI